MKIEPIGHDDLMDRVQDSTVEAGMPDDITAGIEGPHGFGESDEQFREWEGSSRWEIIVPAKALVRAFRRLLGRKEKR